MVGVMVGTWAWSYIGESGHEILGRNSHSMTILESNGHSVIVIFGGASPDHGPLGDTIYAHLPPVDEIGIVPFIFYKLKST